MTTEKIAGSDNTEDASAQLSEIQSQLKERGFETVQELLSHSDSVAEDRDKFKDQHANAEKIVHRQGAELGELRKAKGVSPKKVENEQEVTDDDKAKAEKEKAEKEALASKPKEETLEEVEASLGEEQWKKIDEVFDALPDVEADGNGFSKKLIADDPDLKKKFLSIGRESVIMVPTSLRPESRSVGSKADAEEDRIRKLFGNQKAQDSYTPSGSRQGPVRASKTPMNQKEHTNTGVGSSGVLQSIANEREAVGV